MNLVIPANSLSCFVHNITDLKLKVGVAALLNCSVCNTNRLTNQVNQADRLIDSLCNLTVLKYLVKEVRMSNYYLNKINLLMRKNIVSRLSQKYSVMIY